MPCLVCLHRKRINISTVLAGQRLGIKEVDEGIWLASFMGRFLSKAAEGARAHETLLPMLTQQQRRRSALDRRNPQVKSALCPLCPQHQAAERPLYLPLQVRAHAYRGSSLGSPLKIRL